MRIERGNRYLLQSSTFAMDVKTHWEKVYKTKAPDTVSWYLPHLETSLALIERTGASLSSSIIDVGGGESTLADDLVSRGYQNITVLDISETAVNVSKQRMGEAGDHVQWLVADVLATELKPLAYDVWHDRAVFHFLTTMEQRIA
jgi:2-polyprenyl-3-methyl-5-hydroxy-6-metoxy-1,4-benzoquinol methylase